MEGKGDEMMKAMLVASVALFCFVAGCDGGDEVVPCSEEGAQQGVVYAWDWDCDGVRNEQDNCTFTANGEGAGEQADRDGDTVGDACDPVDDRECLSSADCDDGDDCTVDVCEAGNVCQHIPSDDPACEPEQSECTTDADCAHLNSECYIFQCYPAGSCFPIERDDDGDGYGVDCGAMSGRDCDDHNPAVHPDATEICDGRDNDCDGETDEGCEPPPDCVAGRICDCGADGYGVERCGTSTTCECPVCGDGICTMFWTRTDTGEGYWNCPEDCPPRCEDGHCATVVLRIACPSDDPDCQIWYSAGGAGEAQAGVLQRYVGSLRCADLEGYLAGININARVGGPDGAWYSDVGRLSDLDVTIDDVPGVCSIESDTMAADNWMVEEGATTNLFCPAAYLSC